MRVLSAMEGRHTFKSDVFSFGIVMWEIAARACPHRTWLAELSKEAKGGTVTAESVITAVKQGRRLPIPNGVPTRWAALMSECWDVDPGKRPSMDAVVERLREYNHSLKSGVAAAGRGGLPAPEATVADAAELLRRAAQAMAALTPRATDAQLQGISEFEPALRKLLGLLADSTSSSGSATSKPAGGHVYAAPYGSAYRNAE